MHSDRLIGNSILRHLPAQTCAAPHERKRAGKRLAVWTYFPRLLLSRGRGKYLNAVLSGAPSSPRRWRNVYRRGHFIKSNVCSIKEKSGMARKLQERDAIPQYIAIKRTVIFQDG